MKKIILFSIITLGIGCNDAHEASVDHSVKADSAMVSCKLTSDELQQRRETVLASLKSKVIEKKELANGYAFKFEGSDQNIDELIEFIKTERECCDFFVFGLSISGDKSVVWLDLTGPPGVKDMITVELGI